METSQRTHQHTVLIISTDTEEIFVGWFAQLLKSLDDAYNQLRNIERRIELLKSAIGDPNVDLKTLRDMSIALSARELILGRAYLGSPGIWEFLGELNPLEVIRLALADWHERKKDLQYRWEEEAEELRLKNLLLSSEVVKAWAVALREVGYNDDEIRLLFETHLFWALRPLNDFAPRITGVRIERSDEE